MSELIFDSIPGGSELLRWFGGRTPSFHDAEVLALTLDRESAAAILKVHAFEMTSEVDGNGYFVCTGHVVVTFKLAEITELELDGFNHQNALMGLSVTRVDEGGFRLDMEPAYGLGGFIHARAVEISMVPGIPPGSVYLRTADGGKSNA